jgi:hypothetical protein
MMKRSAAPPPPPLSAPPTTLPLLQPMEVLELLDEAFDLYKRNFRLLFGIAILLNAPISLLTLAFAANLPGMITVRILAYLVQLVSASALTRAAWDRLLARPTTIVTAYAHAMRQLGWVLVGTIGYSLAFIVGLILLVVPGLFVGLCSMLLLPVIMVENRGWYGLFQRPWRIPGGNIWRLFFVALGLFFLGLIIWGVLGAIVGLIVAVSSVNPNRPPDPSNAPEMITMAAYLLISVLIQSAWTPMFTTAQLLAYVDLRVRGEAFDLELLTSAVEARLAAERGAAPPETAVPGQVTG